MSLCVYILLLITSEHTNIGNLLHHPGHDPHLLALLGGVLAVGPVRGQVAERVPAAARVVEVCLDLGEHHHDVVPGRQGEEARLPDRVRYQILSSILSGRCHCGFRHSHSKNNC